MIVLSTTLPPRHAVPMRVDRFLTLRVVAPFRHLCGSSTDDGVLPILMYHSISEDPETGKLPYYKICTSPARFRQQMGWLHDQGYRSVGLDQIASPSTSAKRIAITFDDGYRDNLTAALPVLDEFGFTATVYLPTGYIGDPRRRFNGRDCLTWSEIGEMRIRGFQFGSHTVTHPVLRELSWERIQTELSDSKRDIEDHLQAPITSFAYPYAFPQEDIHYVERFSAAVCSSGYDVCVTTVIGRVRANSDRLMLKRLPINSVDDDPLLAAKITGAYDWMEGGQSWFRQIKKVMGCSGIA